VNIQTRVDDTALITGLHCARPKLGTYFFSFI
jgi:hypothetical protein